MLRSAAVLQQRSHRTRDARPCGGNGADRETENENTQPRQALHGAYRGLSVEWKNRAGCGALSFFTLHYNLVPSKNPGNAVGSVKSET